MKRLTLAFTLTPLLFTALAEEAHADYFKLYAPRVEKGELSLEADLNMNFDHRDDVNHYLSQVYAAEYGVTNWWMTELGAEVEKESGDTTKLTNLKWENVFVPFQPGEYWMDFGGYVELEKGVEKDAPDNAEAKLLLEKDFGRFANIANIGISHEFGQNHSSDTNGSFAWRSAYRLDKTFEPGIEYYADFGALNDIPGFDEQGHLLGPVVQGKLGPVKYDTGALFGISKDAPDAVVKLNLEYEF